MDKHQQERHLLQQHLGYSIYALNVMSPLFFTAAEMFYAGVDPNKMRFKRSGCFDVGVQCGGWGNIVLELHMQDRKKAPEI